MRNSWLIWTFFIGVAVTVLFAFNYQGDKDTIPLSEIFPEEETVVVDIEYQFADEKMTEKVPDEGMSIKSAPEPVVVKKTVSVKPPAAVMKTPSKGQEATKGADAEASGKIYTIQVASHKQKSQAEVELEKLSKKGFDGHIMSKDLGEKGVWYRVIVGRFTDQSRAQQTLVHVKEHYKNSFVILLK